MTELPTIKNRYTGAVLYTGDAGMTTRQMLEKATAARANLAGADLAGADLAGADLTGANLAGADLAGAYLAGAYLAGADLAGAYLAGAYLDNKKLIGERPNFQLGPIGSRCATLQAFITDGGVMVRAGCFYDTLDAFRAAVAKTHGDTDHAKEYEMAILMIEAHAAIWTPTASPATPKGGAA